MTFADIPAQEAVKERLRNLVDSGRLPHALLLEGPEGSLKLQLARALAQYVHCKHPTPDGDACGRCPSCLQHQALGHIDTLYVYPVAKLQSDKPAVSDDYAPEWRDFLTASPEADFERWADCVARVSKKTTKPVIYVDEASLLVRRLALTTHGYKYRFVIFWLPERMNEQCANKLLKLVEEPFPDTVFLFVSDNPAGILPTIYSRCQRIEVKRLPDSAVAQAITASHSMDPADALALAHIAEGNMVRALRMLGADRQATKRFDWFVHVMRSAYARDVLALKTWASDFNSSKVSRDDQVRFFDNAARLIRENFVYRTGALELTYMTRREEEFARRFAPFITERNAERLEAIFAEAARDIAANANARMVAFDTAIKVCFLIKRR